MVCWLAWVRILLGFGLALRLARRRAERTLHAPGCQQSPPPPPPRADAAEAASSRQQAGSSKHSGQQQAAALALPLYYFPTVDRETVA